MGNVMKNTKVLGNKWFWPGNVAFLEKLAPLFNMECYQAVWLYMFRLLFWYLPIICSFENIILQLLLRRTLFFFFFKFSICFVLVALYFYIFVHSWFRFVLFLVLRFYSCFVCCFLPFCSFFVLFLLMSLSKPSIASAAVVAVTTVALPVALQRDTLAEV